MSGIWFGLSSAAATAAFFTHWLVGGRYAAVPLLAATDITEASRWLNYFCWHIVTMLLLVMATVLGLAAAALLSRETVVLVAVISFSISALSVAITLRAGIRPLRFPASYLLAAVGALAAIGLASG